MTEAGRARIAAFLTDYLGEEARGQRRRSTMFPGMCSATSGPRWSA